MLETGKSFSVFVLFGVGVVTVSVPSLVLFLGGSTAAREDGVELLPPSSSSDVLLFSPSLGGQLDEATTDDAVLEIVFESEVLSTELSGSRVLVSAASTDQHQ